jgi:hypothetical protein
LLLC